MNIAIIWESFGPYHFSRYDAFRSHAAVHGHRVYGVEVSNTNITYAWNRSSDEGGAQVFSLFTGEAAENIAAWRVYKRFRAFIKKHSIEVVFAPSYWPGYALAAMIAAKSCKARVVFMTESHYASGNNQGIAFLIKQGLMRFYDAAFVGGTLHRGFVRQLGMPLDKIFDGYDTVDNVFFGRAADDFRMNPERSRIALPLPRRYFLSLGRFVAKKNLELIVRVYADLVREGRHNGQALLFVGSGVQHESVREVALKLGLTVWDHTNPQESAQAVTPGKGVVYFHPFAQVDVVPEYYARATAFILASTTEEWGLVVNEAMACGCPVVVSRVVGASQDLVLHGETGYRFNPDSPSELAWCLERISSSPELAAAMGTHARSHIQNWSNARFATNALRAAESAMQGAHPAGAEPPSVAGAGQMEINWPRVWFLQTCFPDYRMPVFKQLHERLGNEFHLFSGTSYFTPDIKTTPDVHDWHSLVENRFLSGRRFLWQTRACEAMLAAEVVVMELNPRIFSHWVILAARALWGAPTLLWGHAWGRENQSSVRNILRLYMMRLSTGTITYTRTQRDEVRRVFPRFKVFAATNSLICASECSPLPAEVNELDTIIYVGRINRSKKVSLLVEAFIKARLPAHVKLKIVGSGQERELIERYLALKGASVLTRVQFLGHVHSHEILRSLYAKAFCAVSPGYVGLGAIQAFSFGVPLLLADKEPHAPEVEACSKENTVYFESDNASSLALIMEHMWADRSDWLSKRASLAAWTAANYSVEAMVDGFVEAIDAVKDRRRKPRGSSSKTHN